MELVYILGGAGKELAAWPASERGGAGAVTLSPVSRLPAGTWIEKNLSMRSETAQRDALGHYFRQRKPALVVCIGTDALRLGAVLKKAYPAVYVCTCPDKPAQVPETTEFHAVLCRDLRQRRTLLQAGVHPDAVYSVGSPPLQDVLSAIYARYRADAPAAPRRILVSGAYGIGNIGDDAILAALLADIRDCAPDAAVTVLSRNPEKTRLDHGVHTIHSFHLPALFSALRSAELFISGGGSLLTDNTSARSLYYYLSSIAAAKRFGVKVMLYGCGIGPFLKESSRRRTADILNEAADVITVRDALSYDMLRSLGVDQPAVHLAADPAFRLNLSDIQYARARYSYDAALASMLDGLDAFAVYAIRPWGRDPQPLRQIARAADRLYWEKGLTPVLFPMEHPRDVDTLRTLQEIMAAPALLVSDPISAEAAYAMIGRAELVFGMRLHALIFALAAGTPAVGLSYDIKVESFMDSVDPALCLDYPTLTGEVLYEKALAALAFPPISARAETERGQISRTCLARLLSGGGE